MSKQVNKFSLAEILGSKEEKIDVRVIKDEPVSVEVKDLLSKIRLTIGIVSFEKTKIVKYEGIETKITKTALTE